MTSARWTRRAACRFRRAGRDRRALKRRRRRGRTPRSKHLTLSTTDAEWAMVREKAARRGLSMACYVVELVLRREAEPAPMVALDAGEQREHLELVRSLAVLLRGEVDVPAFLEDMRRGIDAVIDTGGARCGARGPARGGARHHDDALRRGGSAGAP